MNIKELIDKIDKMNNCTVIKRAEMPNVNGSYNLPSDLTEFYSLCGGVRLLETSYNTVNIVMPLEFTNANRKMFDDDIIQAEIDKGTYGDEISRHWFIIADLFNSNYIVIDLSEERFGLCYTAFHETYPEEGSCSIIARSFTELLEHFVNTDPNSDYFYFEENFTDYGDAYDDLDVIRNNIDK